MAFCAYSVSHGDYMASRDIAALMITGLLGTVMIILAVLLLSGKGAFFIAGYNTMSKEEKAKYDEKALCRFMGKILLPIGILTPAVALGGMYGLDWIGGVYAAAVAALVVFALVYCNTGNRFKK